MKAVKLFGCGVLFAAAILSLGGCGAMHRAQLAQDEIAAEADDGSPAPDDDFVDLTSYTLDQYVEYALENRPDMIQADLAVSNACLKFVSVTSGEYPILGFAGGHSQSTHNGGSHFSWHQRGNADTSFTMSLLLYDFGRLDAQEAAAQEEIIAAARDSADLELSIFEDVSTAYFTLLRNDALLAVARTNEQQFAEHLRQAETLYAAGEVKNLDVLKARLDLSDAQLETITASNDVTTASANFIRALGLDASRADRLDVLSVAANAFAPPKRDLPESSEKTLDALAFARTNAPSMLALRARLRVASAEVDYAVADLLPSLSLDAGFAWADPAWNFSWGLTAVQSLFEGYRKTTAVDSAVVSMLAAREAVLEAEETLSYKLSVACATRDTARQALETARVQVKQAQENLDDVIAQYRVGEASRIDFADAASSYSTALGVRIKAFYSGQIAEAALLRLTGRTIDLPDRP